MSKTLAKFIINLDQTDLLDGLEGNRSTDWEPRSRSCHTHGTNPYPQIKDHLIIDASHTPIFWHIYSRMN